jgi:competence protein ComEC
VTGAALDRGRRALGAARTYSRHLALAAVVAGLLLGPLGPAGVLPAAALAGLLGGWSRLGLLAAVAVVAGALVATTRLAALDAGTLASLNGRVVSARAVLLEPVHERALGPAVARARLVDGPAAGEQAVLRIGSFAHSGPWPEVGDEVRVRGRVTPLGRADAYQRRRNAHAAIVAYRVAPTGARRGGLAGALDAVRRRAEHGLALALARRRRRSCAGWSWGRTSGCRRRRARISSGPASRTSSRSAART